jgi:uncharacterized protein (TIGR02145 family)
MKKQKPLTSFLVGIMITITLTLISIGSLHAQIFTPGAGVTDVDGNFYRTVVINEQEWTAENARTTKYANGVAIPNITDNTLWSSRTAGAWAYYNNDTTYNSIYGKLYNQYAVADPRNVCPSGWRVPTQVEYDALDTYLSTSVGGKMKSTGTQYWLSPNTGATNESGFSALPGGLRKEDGTFEGIGQYADQWTRTSFNGFNCIHFFLMFDNDLFLTFQTTNKTSGYSVRCTRKAIVSSINEIKNSNIKIYPNPTNNIIIIEGLDKNENNTVQIFDVQGKLVSTKIVNERGTIDLSELNKGVYVIKIGEVAQRIEKM